MWNVKSLAGVDLVDLVVRTVCPIPADDIPIHRSWCWVDSLDVRAEHHTTVGKYGEEDLCDLIERTINVMMSFCRSWDVRDEDISIPLLVLDVPEDVHASWV